jgi:malonate transporter MadM subunit
MIGDVLLAVLTRNSLIAGFVIIGALIWFAYLVSNTLSRGRLHGSAIAIFLGLVLAWIGGLVTGGERGLADIPVFAGVAVMGGAMLRDFAIIATSFGVNPAEMRRAGLSGSIALILGVVVSFVVGAAIAWSFGYTDAVSMTTIGAGAATYIVGPITGAAVGATSDVMALSIAAGLVKSMLVMMGTPFIARFIGLDNPQTAMVFGGLMGTTSGVAGGLAATDPKLVPYGAMTATFYTGLGCLLCPSVLFLAVRALVGG